jgi:hypothetical protein
MLLPTNPGLYIVVTTPHYKHICEWTCEYWCHPGNYIDIAQKYDEHVSSWQDIPPINDRGTSDLPLDNTLCVVKLIGSKCEDHGLAIATYDATNYTFKFSFPYDAWTKDYDDWQFVGWTPIPS